jgi:hypothetical protein
MSAYSGITSEGFIDVAMLSGSTVQAARIVGQRIAASASPISFAAGDCHVRCELEFAAVEAGPQ